MIWIYKKLSDDENTVVYSYKWGTEETDPGEILYDKITKEVKMLKIAGNDNKIGAKWAEGHFLEVIKNGFPDEKTVMIG